MIWHSTSKEEVLKELDVDEKIGLANGVVDEKIKKYGKNIITKSNKISFLKRFSNQLKDKTLIALIIISLISFVLSLVYDEVNWFSSLLIIAIVLLNAAISAYHLYRCDNSLEEIKHYTNPSAQVLREGNLKTINSIELVPGDIIVLEEGDYVPADARLIDTNEFRVSETFLTGVEVPVEKNADEVFEDIIGVEQRSNMIFSGSSVIHGKAKAVVIATGLQTEVGKSTTISEQTGDDKLPLEAQLDSLSKIVNIGIFTVCAVVFAIGMIQNFSSDNFAGTTIQTLLNAVALAVAAIPEGLPAITTIVIAIGIQRILLDKIVIKDVSATELLGKTDVLCCDKTGVFTRNKMVLKCVFDGKKITELDDSALEKSEQMVINLATACSTLTNDSTEQAIEDACLKYNAMSKIDIDNMFPHISGIPFDSERKTMTVITMINERPFAIVKGAPESMVPKCINCKWDEVLKLNEKLTGDALRVICVAMKPLNNIPANPTPEEIENNLVFVGLLGIDDPPREGIVEDVAAVNNAGIKTVMITGDNLNTAKSVARRIGVLKDETTCITGAELNEMSDEELYDNVEKISVYARVSPSDKLRIVKAWQKHKKVVTITGDSIQDTDALALADVGCAIGRYGADVAKGNADIIISNNRFDSVLSAIKESRGLFSNIRKSVCYLLSCNFAEILIMLIGMIIFEVPPVAAVQLLWINLLTDCAPAISLSMERAEDIVMTNRQKKRVNKLFGLKNLLSVVVQCVFITIITLTAFALGNDFNDTSNAMTMAFATLGFSQIFHCFNIKFEGTIFNKRIFDNKFMNISALVTLFILIFLIFTPAGAIFGLTALTFAEFIICLFLSISIIPVCEILKIATANM